MSLLEQLKGVQIVNPGFLFDKPTGLGLDANGSLVIEGVIFKDFLGLKLDDDGRILAEGAFIDEPTGLRIDQDGWLLRDGGIFVLDEALGIRIDSQGRLYKASWTGFDERVDLSEVESSISENQKTRSNMGSDFGSSQSSYESDTAIGGGSGDGIGAFGKGVLIFLALIALGLYGRYDQSKKQELAAKQRIELQEMQEEIKSSKNSIRTIVPPARGFQRYNHNVEISATNSEILIQYPGERSVVRVYFYQIRSIDGLNNPYYLERGYPCFYISWVSYRFTDTTWRYSGNDRTDRTYCITDDDAYIVLQAINKAYNDWQKSFPKLVKYLHQEPAEVILRSHLDIGGVYAVYNNDNLDKKVSRQRIYHNGETVTLMGPGYRAVGNFNGKHGKAAVKNDEGKDEGLLEFYVDNEGRIHGRLANRYSGQREINYTAVYESQ